MRDPTVNGAAHVESVTPLAPAHKRTGSDSGHQLDQAGQSFLSLLQRAAGVAEENSRHALDMAQKLSYQLRAAEDRIAELEAEVVSFSDRADRAEQWLHTPKLRSAFCSNGRVPGETGRDNDKRISAILRIDALSVVIASGTAR